MLAVVVVIGITVHSTIRDDREIRQNEANTRNRHVDCYFDITGEFTPWQSKDCPENQGRLGGLRETP